MKWTVLSVFLLVFLSCSEKILENGDCPDLICTEEFRSVSLRFKNASGQLIAVNSFSAKIRRTGKSPDVSATDSLNFKGYYTVATDNDLGNLSSAGDTIDVSAVNPATGQKKIFELVVKGGKCNCHIQKISGPEEVVFD